MGEHGGTVTSPEHCFTNYRHSPTLGGSILPFMRVWSRTILEPQKMNVPMLHMTIFVGPSVMLDLDQHQLIEHINLSAGWQENHGFYHQVYRSGFLQIPQIQGQERKG